MSTAPLALLERLQQFLAADLAIPLKDGAGIINPQGVDAAHRAAGLRRAIDALRQSEDPCSPPTPSAT
jgi:hypothetical protein